MSAGSSGSKNLTLKEKFQISFTILFIIAIIGNTIYQNHLEHEAKLAKIAKYKVLAVEYQKLSKTCIPFESIPSINYLNNPRSNDRVSSVINRYQAIMAAKCFIGMNETIYRNPYRNLGFKNLSTASSTSPSYEIWQGIIYDVDSGMPFMRTGGSICADGSYSPSVGRGTCSWHGGYGSQRGEKFDYKFSEKSYDPRIVLARLLG